MCSKQSAPYLRPRADFVGPMRMSHHREMVRVSLLDHRLDLVFLHQVLVDELDDVDAGGGQLAHLLHGHL